MARVLGSSDRCYEVSLRWKADLMGAGLGDIERRCTCPDRALRGGDPCKHVVALCYRLAERLAEDPRAFIALRGSRIRLEIDYSHVDPRNSLALSASFYPPLADLGARVRGPRRPLPLWLANRHPGGTEAISALFSLCPSLPELLALRREPSVEVGRARLGRFFAEERPRLRAMGAELALSKPLRRELGPKLVLVAEAKGSRSFTTFLGLSTLLTYDRRIALGGLILSPEEFESLVGEQGEIVAFREGFARIDPAEAASLLREARAETPPSPLDLVRARLAGEAVFSADAEELASSLFRERPVPVPASLAATLRPYQERGYRWAYTNLMGGFGCVLADDMGLGKTVQAIALMLRLSEEGLGGGGFLVVAPAALLENWERELARFAPSLARERYHGPGRALRGGDGVVVTTYETATRDRAALAARDFALLVADEAQVLKNASTRRARALRELRARRKLALSGTPVENKLEDMRAIFDLVMPGYLGSAAEFRKAYRRPIEAGRDPAAAERLKRITSPFLLRRLKTDPSIAPDLPAKSTIDEYASLAEGQAALYESVVRRGTEEALAAETPAERLVLVLRLITSLKQVCDHPRIYDKESPAAPELSGKALLLLELLGPMLGNGEKVLVFSQFVECLELLGRILARELGEDCILYSGRLDQAARMEAVDAFQRDAGRRIMLVSLRAGGLGLNLTAASRVIHYDLWFNPAVEDQATDRAFRIGQRRDVFVHRLITAGTIEERLDAMLKSKRELVELCVASGESWLSRMGDEELREIFGTCRDGSPTGPSYPRSCPSRRCSTSSP